ncbi:MAG TPA: class I SAM-dependent methyltransferase [Pyrinomonadaceae bacterium]|nr:class I SAM-dependent methyltransferase [Pyrinomonadaceae bacterium]
MIVKKKTMELSGQNDSGLNRLFTISAIYELFQQRVLGGNSARKWLAENVWKLQGGETIVDIGCGSGTILKSLPGNISYCGLDISENYIRAARRNFSDRGTFFLGTLQDLLNQNAWPLNSADLILCNGLLHHLGDADALEVLELSKRLMKDDGRLICLEAVFLDRQTRLSKWFVSADRGRHVRSEAEWKKLISQAFSSYATRILTGLIRIPYTHIIIESRKGPVVA